MSEKIDWVIHYCTNCVCDECGKDANDFLPYTCNAHTHGMEKYGHMDFQIVLALSPEEIGYILNSLGKRVQAGERFHRGNYVSGIYLDCDVWLEEFEETGRQVLRVVIPDRNNCFPEDPKCESPYTLQVLKTNALYTEGGNGICS